MTETPRSYALLHPPTTFPAYAPEGIVWPDSRLEDAWWAGEYTRSTTEPWTMQLLASLIVALGAKNVLETGTSQGLSTLWLAHAAHANGGRVTTVDADAAASSKAQELIGEDKNVTFVTEEATEFLRKTHKRFDFVFLDDLHAVDHVNEEIELLRASSPGAIVAIHDLYNTPGLVTHLLTDLADVLMLRTRSLHIGCGIALLSL